MGVVSVLVFLPPSADGGFFLEGDGMERDIERKLKKRVESTGGWCLKFLSSISGVPDRLCLFEGGVIVFVETKIQGGKPRPFSTGPLAPSNAELKLFAVNYLE